MKARPAAALALVAALAAGCGSGSPAARGPAAEAPPGGAPFLATSQVTAAGSWAVAVMGGSAASHNNFWQLFIRPPGSSRWKLATPPGVADNGGLVVAGADGGRSLVTAFRPSRYLTFTPLTVSRDGGRTWAAAGPLDAALADTPGALAAAPGTGRLLALLTSGAAQLAAPGYTRWVTLTTRRVLAVTPAGRRCGIGRLTAAAFTPSGAPLLAGTCRRPGTVGIFAGQGGAWRAAGPVLHGSLARRVIAVTALTATARGTVALLSAGSGPAASLAVAWSTPAGGWALSAPLALHGSVLRSASFTGAGAVAATLAGGHGETITGPQGSWQPLPALPRWTQTLAPGPAGQADALAAHGATLTVWVHTPGAAGWAEAQTMHVPVQYGSSG